MAEAIDLRDKRLKHFKSTKLHVDEELYKEAKYQAQKLIKEKKAILQRKTERKYW